jgi:hypothetical protein
MVAYSRVNNAIYLYNDCMQSKTNAVDGDYITVPEGKFSRNNLQS